MRHAPTDLWRLGSVVRTAQAVMSLLGGNHVVRAPSDWTVPAPEYAEWFRLVDLLERTPDSDELKTGLAADFHWRVWRWCVAEGIHIDVSPPPTLSSSSTRFNSLRQMRFGDSPDGSCADCCLGVTRTRRL